MPSILFTCEEVHINMSNRLQGVESTKTEHLQSFTNKGPQAVCSRLSFVVMTTLVQLYLFACFVCVCIRQSNVSAVLSGFEQR